MNISKITGVKIEGVVGCVPEIMVNNEEILPKLYGKEAETIIKTTGIRKRYLAKEKTTSLDLCCFCAEKLIEKTNTPKEEIGGVVFVTFTPDNIMPCNAVAAQARLGLMENTAAFDVGLACSGYGYGLWLASFMAKSLGKKILLLDGDVQSVYLSPKDKSTVPVLSDAGSATLVSPSDSEDEWEFSFLSDGSQRDVLIIPAGGAAHPTKAEDLEFISYEDGSERRNRDIYMDGFEIFKFVAQRASNFMKEFMTETGNAPDTLDFFVPHQANIYMIGQLARKLKINKEIMWVSGDEVGNSASATVPVTISRCAGDALVKEKSSILFAGYGGGLSISCARIVLHKDAYYDFYHYGEQ